MTKIGNFYFRKKYLIYRFIRYLNTYQHYIVNENSKNDPIPEINQGGKLGIVLIGAPGIGKSTFAKNYITHKNQNIKIFSTDDVSLTLTKQHDVYRRGSSELNLKKLFMFMKSGGSFIYDTTGVKKQNVESVTKEARDNGYNIVYVHLVGTLDLSLKQNLQRERNVPEDVIKNIYAEQFTNMKYFSSLNPDTYYIVYNIDLIFYHKPYCQSYFLINLHLLRIILLLLSYSKSL